MKASNFSPSLHSDMLFDAVQVHVDFVERHLADQLKHIEDAMDAEIAEYPEGEEGTYRAYNDTWIDAAWMMPTLQWWSSLLIVYALFEKQLYEICAHAKERTGAPMSFKDVAGNGIERAATYLSKVIGVSKPFGGAGWAQAKLLGELRNALAHKAGLIDVAPDNRGSLYNRLSRLPDIEFRVELAEQGQAAVVFNGAFVTKAVSTLKALIREVAHEVDLPAA
jgi:hypothetical protein